MKFSQKIADMDVWTCDKLEEAYLWAYDWTGVTVGTCMAFSILAISTIEVAHSVTTFEAIVPLIGNAGCLFGAFSRFTIQNSENDTMYNLIATMNRNHWIRKGFTFITYVFILMFAVTQTLDEVAIFSFFQLYNLLGCVRIRKRNKKTFKLPSLAMPKLAPQASS